MSYGILLPMLILVILARLRLTFRDDGARPEDLMIIGALPLTALVFLEINAAWFALLLFFPLMALLLRWTERRAAGRDFWRLGTLALYVAALVVLCSPLGGLNTNHLPDAIVDGVAELLAPGRSLGRAALLQPALYILGLMLVLNESNIVLRYLLQVLQLQPKRESGDAAAGGPVDEREYNTGRVIGMLERIFVYVFVLAGQYAAIGFILAAKGVARFHELENRTFAEYVLIGTLLSTLLAALVGYFVAWAASF